MTIWIGLLLALCVLTAVVLTRRRRVRVTELGTVSEQWLLEHRGYNRQYSER